MPESKKKVPFGPKTSNAGSKKEEPAVQVIGDGDGPSGSARGLLSAPPPASLDSTSKSKPASSKSPLRFMGMTLLLGGVGLAFGGMYEPSLAPYQVHSVSLIVGGLFVFLAGALRKTLNGIRSTIDCVSNETLRLEQLSIENKGLKDDMRGVGEVASGLRGDVSSLHERVERLLAITSDSDFQTSIFQLAASLDQVGARLDMAMKDRFKTLEGNLSRMGEKRDQASKELGTKLQEVGDLLKAQDQVLQSVQEEYARKVEQAAAETQARIDRAVQSLERLEHELEQHQLAVAEGLQGLSDGAQQHASEAAQGLGELRGHVSQQVEEKIGSLREQLDGMEGHFAKIDREHAAAMNQLAERLERELSTRAEAIQESLKTLEQLSAEGDDQLARDELERSLREQLDVLRSVVEEAARTAAETGAGVGDGVARLGEGVTSLGERLEGIVDERFDTLSLGLTAVVKCATETAANVQKLMTGDQAEPQGPPMQTVEKASPRLDPASELAEELVTEPIVTEEVVTGEVVTEGLDTDHEDPDPFGEAVIVVVEDVGEAGIRPPAGFPVEEQDSEQPLSATPSEPAYDGPEVDASSSHETLPGPFEAEEEAHGAPEGHEAHHHQAEPPSALPQHPAPGPVFDPWAPNQQAESSASYPPQSEQRPDHDPLADPFGRHYDDGSQDR